MPCLGEDRIALGIRKSALQGASATRAAYWRFLRRAYPALVLVTAMALMSAAAARAATITVDTTSDPSMPGQCGLRDAINAANGQASVDGCAAGSSKDDAIVFQTGLTGTIGIGSTGTLPAIVNGETLTIQGPAASPGITIDGGGSVQLIQVQTGATLNLQFLTLAHGSVTGLFPSQGGAILNNGTLNVTNSTFSANQAIGGSLGGGGDGEGGAILNNGTLNVTNSTFFANHATGGKAPRDPVVGHGEGGAIYNQGTLSVTDSTFSANQATGSAPAGGGINNNGATVTLKGTILAASSPGNCGGSAVTDAGYNISDDSTCGFSATGSAMNGVNVDPKLAPLADNGGPTMTFALESGSPAIDAVPLADCTDQASPTPNPIITDQRGFGRPDPGDSPAACDIGAYESGAVPIDCSQAAASAPSLWPPNGKFVSESILGVTDSAGAFSINITGIFQDEPVANDGTCPDATGVGASVAQVRAERDSSGDGRVYHIQFTATDTSTSGSCSGEVEVCVSHDRAHLTCGDQGALDDSTICPP
jgi:hypothetical protein